jgi:acetyl-CoA carboxylase alpha subunit
MSNLTKVSDTVELNAAGFAALQVFVAAKEAEKAAKTAKAKAEALLREALGDAVVATYNGVAALKVQFRTNSHIDKNLLQAAFPEAYEFTLVNTPYTFLTNM